MNILVDTSVWSEALRKGEGTGHGAVRGELTELIREQRVVVLGCIRQELLAGIKEAASFAALRQRLHAFPDFPVQTEDYELAAELFNHFRSKGIQGSNTDFLICAVAQNHRLGIFSTDNDFAHFAKHTRIRLHAPRP